MKPKTRKIILSSVPYVFAALFATKLGLAWRLTEGADASEKVLSIMAGVVMPPKNLLSVDTTSAFASIAARRICRSSTSLIFFRHHFHP